MKQLFKTGITALLVCACALFTSACGTSDGLDEAASSFDTSAIKTDSKIASMVSKSVSQDGLLTVGSNLAYAPAEFTGEDNKTALGYEIDIIKAIGAVLGLKVKIVNSSFDSIIPSVGSKYDVGISGFTITTEREKSVNWVQHYTAGQSFAVKKGNPEKVNTKNLCGRTVAVQIGTAQETSIIEMSAQCEAQGKEAINYLSFNDQPSASTAVVAGRADAMYSDTPVVEYAVKQTGTLQVLGDPINVAPNGIVISKNDMQTTKAINAALQELIDNGTYMKILKSWGTTSGAVEKAVINPKIDD